MPRRLWAIGAISFGTALLVLDNAIATIALPTIAEALDVPQASAVTIVTVYQLVLLMALLPFSALGDRIGHKRLYQSGQITFVLASLLCFFAVNLPMLLAARAAQALGVAAVLAVSAALLRRIYPSAALGRGLGLNSIIIGSAAAFAPTVGGLILALGSWRWVFLAAAPFAVLSLAIGRFLPAPPPARKDYDLAGAALCALMFGALIGALELHVHGSAMSLTAPLALAGLVGTWLFVRRERGREAPILPIDLLSKPAFALATTSALLSFVASIAFTLSLPFRLGSAYALSPAEIGAVMAAWPLTMMIVAPFAGYLSDRAPKGLLGGLGMILCCVAFLLMSRLPTTFPGFGLLIGPLMLGGVGSGLFLAPNSHLILSSAPSSRSASAGAMISTTRLLGSALGATVLAALLASGLGHGPGPALVAAACAAVAAACSFANLKA
ncbi:MFS transporter [Brevundimonas sp. S30B]|uniref:MFS transporter n=1 Tax=unclassified Brevundimonas TaxID=2622653 RepID=UPI001071F872|nr:MULTISPECIES: MFS transporter [unclassified Brevundimonas]QBX36682.1 MFS transporter [Brevundimonas sp. MF30-B]TFW04523.1 MFS transporter [Brevundimonas sp. S30B]